LALLADSTTMGREDEKNGEAELGCDLRISKKTLTVATRSGSSGERHSRGQLLINACGQTLELDMLCARSITDLVRVLQLQLNMEAQQFELFDVSGTTLRTDSQLHDAVAKGRTPLLATLSDDSIHVFESRREELAQMQWKLVREQLMIASAEIRAVDMQLKDTQHQLEQFKQQATRQILQVQDETLKAVASEREAAQFEFRQVSERVTAIADTTSVERQKRDIAVKGLEKQLESIRGVVDNERIVRKQEVAWQTSALQDLKAVIEILKKELEAYKDKHAFDIRGVLDKTDEFRINVREMLQDHQMEAANTAEDLHTHLRGHLREANRLRADLDSTANEAQIRFVQMEGRCIALENRVAELTSRQAATVERLVERQERVSQDVETVKLDEKQNRDQVQVALTRMKDLQQSFEQTEVATRDWLMQEREGRDQQMRHAQMFWRTEQKRQLSELEEKWADRLDQESNKQDLSRNSSKQDLSSKRQESNERKIWDVLGESPRELGASSSSSSLTEAPGASPVIQGLTTAPTVTVNRLELYRRGLPISETVNRMELYSPQRERSERKTCDAVGVTPRIIPRVVGPSRTASTSDLVVTRTASTSELVVGSAQTASTSEPPPSHRHSLGSYGRSSSSSALTVVTTAPKVATLIEGLASARSLTAGATVCVKPPVWQQDGAKWCRIGPHRR